MAEKKFLTDSRNLNISIILGVILAIIGIVFGLLYTILGTLMPYMQDYVGRTPTDVSNWDTEVWNLWSLQIRLLGFFFLSYSLLILYSLFIGIRKKEKWAWHVIFINSIFALIPLTYVSFIVGGFGYIFIITAITLILAILILSIPYKEIFK